MTKKTDATRERWLVRGAEELGVILKKAAGVDAPPSHVSVGFPKGPHGRGRAIGQCWNGALSEDGRAHLFVSPELGAPTRVLDVLLHEVIHAAVGTECGHRGAFAKAARAVGLVRPWTATTAGPELQARLEAVAARLGAYPHSVLAVLSKPRPGSRLRLFECECGVKVRAGRDELRATCDDCGSKFERAE